MVHYKKGSPEAKAFMARLRAMRGSNSRRRRRVKGGNEVVADYGKFVGDWFYDHQAYKKQQEARKKELERQLRAKRMYATQKPHSMTFVGKSPIEPLSGGMCYKSPEQREREREEAKRHKEWCEKIGIDASMFFNPPSSHFLSHRIGSCRGGKIESRDVLDFFAGPIGWTMMGLRKKRDREIAEMENELKR